MTQSCYAPASRRRGPFALALWLGLCGAIAGADALNTLPAQAASPGFTPADYIMRFVQYVRWPGEDALHAWRICVAAAAEAQRPHYIGAQARGRGFDVVAADDPAATADCQVLDLTALPLAQAQAYLAATRDTAVLSVGSGAEFCSAGGRICLKQGASEPVFEINLSAIRRAGLLVNARLMKLGQPRGDAQAQP